MKSEFQVGRIMGIPITIHWTLLIFIPILGFLIASNLENVTELPFLDLDASALTSETGRLFAGFVVTIGLFVSVLLHELGHAWVALRNDVGVKKITLWIFGGLAQLDGIQQDPKVEAKVAIAGPLVSLALGFMPAAFILFDPGAYALFLVGYLAYLNVVLAVFNMIPAFPLDGGRLLRAVLAMGRPFTEATKIASDIGKGLAVLMGLAGLFGSVWLILIAFFIYMAASQEAQGVELFDALGQIEVAEIMDHDVEVATPEMYVDELVPMMLTSQATGFAVVDGPSVVGVVTLSDIRDVPEAQRPLVRVREVMTQKVQSIAPRQKAGQALRTMMEEDIGRLVVEEHGQLVGMVTRQGIMQAFQILKIIPQVDIHEVTPHDPTGADPGEEHDPYLR